MGADDDVDFAGFHIGEDRFLFGSRAETAKHFDARRKRGEALLKGFEMLKREDRGGSKNSDLLVIGDGFEGGAHGDFGLAIAHVAAEEAIHGGRLFEVLRDVADSGDLVGRFLELERVCKLALPIAIGRKGKTLSGLAFGVKSEELVGHVLEGFADAGLARSPRRAAKPVERGMNALDGVVALNEVHALEGNVEASIFGVAKEHEFAATPFRFDQAKAFKLADAVVDVDDEVARLEFGKIAEETGGADLAAGTLDGGRNVEEVSVTVKSDLGFRKSHTSGKRSAKENEGGGFGRVFRSEAGGGFFGFTEDVRDFVFATDVGKAFEFAEAGGGEIGSATGGELGFDAAETGNDIAVEARGGTRSELEARASVGDEAELLEFNARAFEKGAMEFGFAPKIVGDLRGVGLAVALVVFSGGFEMLAGGFAKVDGLVEEHNRFEGTFGEFEERGGAGLPAAADPAAGFPVEGFVAAAGGNTPFGERKNGGLHHGGDGALGAWIEFANAFDGVAEKFEPNRTGRFGREDVDDPAANGELPG